jgi:hypothetical protein
MPLVLIFPKNVKLTELLGFTWDVPFSPLEEKVTTYVAAVQAEDAEVNLLAWSLQQETAKEAKASVILCNFTIWWWAHNLKREARCWCERICPSGGIIGRAWSDLEAGVRSFSGKRSVRSGGVLQESSV